MTPDMSGVGSSTVTKDSSVPAWWDEMDFCHVDDGSGSRSYCGEIHGIITCADYDGEAICPSCGSPTCPRCAQLSAIEDALDES